MKGTLLRIDAAAIIDAQGTFFAPAAVLVRLPSPDAPLPRLLAVGPPAELDALPLVQAEAAAVRRLALPTSVLIPGLVNAHTHLDLTHIGPQPHSPADGFVPWIDMIRRRRETTDDAIAASVCQGITLSLAGGTVAVGDIAGAAMGKPSLQPWRTLRDSAMLGVSFLEFFSRGSFRDKSLAAGLHALAVGLAEPQDPLRRLGLQPHAPNTVELPAFLRAIEAAAAAGAPLSTHLAESPEERRFIADALGPQRELLVSLGLWDDQAAADIGRGLHPIEHLRPALAAARFLVAHVNDAAPLLPSLPHAGRSSSPVPDQGAFDDRLIRLLADTGASVAYCPRSSAYFGADACFGPHRYRDMLAAGVRVCLGTDSIVNLAPCDATRPYLADDAQSRLSILDEMRLLHRRDDADPLLLLRMATLHGAQALGLPDHLVSFAPPHPTSHKHDIAGVVAVDVAEEATRADPNAASLLRAVLRSDAPPVLLVNAVGSSH